MQQVRKKRRRRYAAPVGGLFLVLALVGVIAVVIFSINLTSAVLDNSNEKEKLDRILRPVLMFNPVPFENPADIPPQQLLLYSMWANLSSEKFATYAYDENAELIVPASDLDVAAARMFGPDIKLEHHTFYDDQTTYYYDAERNIYTMPVSAQLYVYSPQVLEITREQKDIYNVLVAYIPPTNAWTADFSGNRGMPQPEKEMIYVVKKVGGSYQILALRDLPADNAAELSLASPAAGGEPQSGSAAG